MVQSLLTERSALERLSRSLHKIAPLSKAGLCSPVYCSSSRVFVVKESCRMQKREPVGAECYHNEPTVRAVDSYNSSQNGAKAEVLVVANYIRMKHLGP